MHTMQILKNVKAAAEVRSSVCHAAVIFANAMMHSGTTVDAFLRDNLDWLRRAQLLLSSSSCSLPALRDASCA